VNEFKHDHTLTCDAPRKITSPSEPAPKKAKIVKLAGKVMATIFWDACGIIHIDFRYFPSKQTINAIITQPWIVSTTLAFKEKTFPFGEEKSVLSSRKCTGLHVPGTDGQIQRIPLPHPAYSPDLVLCDYFLFLNLKKPSSEEKNLLESSSSPKQRLILKGWINHIIRT